MAKRQKLVNLHTSDMRAPSASVLNYGEIAVQHNAEEAALYIKTGENSVEKFISETGVKSLISGASQDFIALKSEVVDVQGAVSAIEESYITAVTVNEVDATVSNNGASVVIDSDDIKLGTEVSYSGETLSTTANTVTEALQAIANKVSANEETIETIISESHSHDNKAVLDGITSEKVTSWDNAVSSAHTHENKAVIDGITSEKVTAWDAAAESAHTHDNIDVLTGITAEKVTAWDEAAASAHDHTNKAELDLIESGDVAKWNALSGAATVVVSARTTELNEGVLKAYDVYQGETVVGTIDIPKDLVVTSGGIVTVSDVKYLRLYIANQTDPVDIAVSELVDAYTEGDGIEISTGNVVSAKVVAANGLSVDSNGIAMALASGEANGAMSSADYTKLAGIASGAQVNVIEGVQVNGADLTADANKKVNVTVTSGSVNGTIAVNGVDVEVTGLGSAAFADTTDFDAAGDAAAASAAAVTAVVGDMTGDTKTLGALQDEIEGLDLGEDNIIEEVQVNGVALTVENKAVNVTITTGTTDGTIAVNGTDVAVTGLGSAAFSAATDFDAAGAAAAASAAAITSANTYTDTKVASYVSAATGDTLISATASGNTVFVEGTQTLYEAVSAATTSLQGIESGKESGAQVNANNELDFSEFGIDCGEY